MKKKKLITDACAIAVMLLASTTTLGVTKNYGTVTLSSNSTLDAGNFPDVWDLTQADMTITFTVDLTGLVDAETNDWDKHAWSELGVRDTSTTSNFNPGGSTGGKGIWLSTDFEGTVGTFDPDPPGNPTLDLDDKLILQRTFAHDEGDYDLPSVPPHPYDNYGLWYDRDGVDPYQAGYWGAVDGGTYNTNGIYDVVITLHATSDTTGTAFMTINGISQGFYQNGWKNAQPEIYPAGMTFTGDMTQLQVFYGLYGYGDTHTVQFSDITVTGVPEPATMALLMVGLAGLLGKNKRT